MTDSHIYTKRLQIKFSLKQISTSTSLMYYLQFSKRAFFQHKSIGGK